MVPMPPTGDTPPPILPWYRAYCALMAVLYVVVAGVGVFLAIAHQSLAEGDPTTSPMEMLVIGVVCAVMGLALVVPFVLAFFLPRRPWVWVYHLVLICLGMTSACCLPATVPLLIFWIKPETKGGFGRG
jgi:hypothetical protein